MRRRIPDRVVAACEREYDRLVEYEREERQRQKYLPKAPHIGDLYLPEQHDDMMRKVAKAIAAVEQHKRTTSYSWANPLPLRMEELETFISNDCNALRLLGYFGRSWRWNNWDERHPPFDVFASGVMDFICSPPELRMDRELQRMFPPAKLVGMTTPLQWRSPNR